MYNNMISKLCTFIDSAPLSIVPKKEGILLNSISAH